MPYAVLMGEGRNVGESQPNLEVVFTASAGIGKTSTLPLFHRLRVPQANVSEVEK